MPEIRFEAVTKRFGSVVAVDELSLEVREGELLALLGPSGCGKTTSLRMVASLERPSSGAIVIGGRDVTDVPPRERGIAMVFQDYALYPHMTVRENIAYPLRVRHASRAEIDRAVARTSDMFQIGQLLDRRPGQLSGGQQQRVAVARSLAYQPQALLLDEPLSNLDAKLRLEARGFLKHFQKTLGVTTMYVTHDQAEAMAIADRIAVMNEGRLLQVDTPLAVYRRPADAFVASFIGSPPMNLIPARLSEGALQIAGVRLDAGPRRAALAAAFAEGDELLVGVRPEHLRIGGREGAALPGEIYAVEPLGAETLVRVKVGDLVVVARLPGDDVPDLGLGAPVGVSADLARALYYRPAGALVVG